MAKVVRWANRSKASMPWPLKESKTLSVLEEVLLCLRVIGANSCMSVFVYTCVRAGVRVAVDERHTS